MARLKRSASIASPPPPPRRAGEAEASALFMPSGLVLPKVSHTLSSAAMEAGRPRTRRLRNAHPTPPVRTQTTERPTNSRLLSRAAAAHLRPQGMSPHDRPPASRRATLNTVTWRALNAVSSTSSAIAILWKAANTRPRRFAARRSQLKMAPESAMRGSAERWRFPGDAQDRSIASVAVDVPARSYVHKRRQCVTPRVPGRFNEAMVIGGDRIFGTIYKVLWVLFRG